MKNISEYIEKLMKQPFEGWSRDAKDGYITACISILEESKKEKIKRYDIDIEEDWDAGDIYWKATEDKDGDWIKYEDFNMKPKKSPSLQGGDEFG